MKTAALIAALSLLAGPAAASSDKEHPEAELIRTDFRCASGEILTVAFLDLGPDDAFALLRDGDGPMMLLPQQVSGSGFRYETRHEGADYVLTGKGDAATLTRDGVSVMADCATD
ncbi:MAG: MliC family protein [Paracoccus sp. (in: a-proteobacteria)]|nr:MliC family protein [Paracoccus sp. (in: a-proteobacteria)]